MSRETTTNETTTIYLCRTESKEGERRRVLIEIMNELAQDIREAKDD